MGFQCVGRSGSERGGEFIGHRAGDNAVTTIHLDGSVSIRLGTIARDAVLFENLQRFLGIERLDIAFHERPFGGSFIPFYNFQTPTTPATYAGHK